MSCDGEEDALLIEVDYLSEKEIMNETTEVQQTAKTQSSGGRGGFGGP